MNKVIISGNLTKDADLTTTANGTSVARFTVAVSRRFKNADGERETDFINCVAWRTTAENLCRYCHKGDKIAVVGAVQTRTFEAQDGTKRYVTEIVADEVEFISIKKDAENYDDMTPVEQDEDLPF